MRWLLVACGVTFLGVTSVASADPAASPASPLRQHLELELPFLKPVRFSFSSVSTPGFEALALPTFSADTTWLERGPLSVLTFTRVEPALELDCALSCQPLLESSFGFESRFALGAVGPALPQTWLFTRAERVQGVQPTAGGASVVPRATLVRAGFAGFLDF